MNAWRMFADSVSAMNRVLGYASALLIVFSSLILTYEVIMRYYFLRPSTWVVEACIFLLVAATFLAAGFTQLRRAHVSINVIDGVCSERMNAWRYLIVDTAAMLLCIVVAVLSWRHFIHVWSAGWTFPTMWGPKMWIPYSFIAVGMTFLVLQQFIQIIDERIPALSGSGQK